MPDAQDPWETETLTPIQDAEVTVQDAYWENGQYGTQMVWVMSVDIPHDPIDIPFETFNQWYSCGKDWVVEGGGSSIIKPTSDPTKPSKIHASSNYGKLMNRVRELGVDMGSRGNPTEAKVWKGLRFHMQRETVKYTGLPTPEGGTIDKEASILLPVSALPAIGATAAPAPVTVASATPAPPVAAPVAAIPGSVPIPVDGTAEAHLISVVLGKSSIVEAKQAAVRDPAIAADDALSSKILENNLIESYFEGASPVLVMANDRIARASG